MEIVNRKIQMRNQFGLHLRLASDISRIANMYDADITILKDDYSADVRSIFDLLILGAMTDDLLVVSAVGKDAGKALNTICDFLESYSDLEAMIKAPRRVDFESYAA